VARPKARKPDSPDPLPPLVPVTSTKFDKDSRLLSRRGKDLAKLEAVVATLSSRGPLARSHKDHALVGDWKGYRECHVEGDWLLIYRVADDKLHLARTGTHSDLFE
jgi:mRNA interferase YafQ